jgi:hypothetical protein
MQPRGEKKAFCRQTSRYLGEGQTEDGLSWSMWQFKRGTLLSDQTKEWGVASNRQWTCQEWRMCTDVFHLGLQHQGPFWLPTIFFFCCKKNVGWWQWWWNWDLLSWPFVIGIKMCTSDGYHGVGWGLQKAYGAPKGRCGVIKANGVPWGMWGAIRHVGCH